MRLSTGFSRLILNFAIDSAEFSRFRAIRISGGSAAFGFSGPGPARRDSSRILSIGIKGEGVAERRQSNEDELFQLTICVALALVAAASLLGPYFDGVRTVGLIAALIHLKPFGLLADHMDWLLAAPYFGGALFAPASFARGVPMEFEAVAALSSEYREAVMAGSGVAAAVLYGPCFVWMAASCRMFRPDLAHRTVHDLASLVGSQWKRWPQSRYASRFLNLTDGSGNALSSDVGVVHAYRQAGQLVWTEPPPMLPPHSGCSMRPEDWLEAQGYAAEGVAARIVCRTRIANGFSEDGLCEAFDKQLGKPWKGFAGLAPCKRALAAALACFHNHESEKGHDLMNRLSMLAAGRAAGRLGMDEAISRDGRLSAEIDGILDSGRSCGLNAVAMRHAWETTAMIAMLMAARKDRGVIPSASFLWVKREDRGLWYALNNSGNAAIMAEAAGALAHFRAERQIGRPCGVPRRVRPPARFLRVTSTSRPRGSPSAGRSPVSNSGRNQIGAVGVESVTGTRNMQSRIAFAPGGDSECGACTLFRSARGF